MPVPIPSVPVPAAQQTERPEKLWAQRPSWGSRSRAHVVLQDLKPQEPQEESHGGSINRPQQAAGSQFPALIHRVCVCVFAHGCACVLLYAFVCISLCLFFSLYFPVFQCVFCVSMFVGVFVGVVVYL